MANKLYTRSGKAAASRPAVLDDGVSCAKQRAHDSVIVNALLGLMVRALGGQISPGPQDRFKGSYRVERWAMLAAFALYEPRRQTLQYYEAHRGALHSRPELPEAVMATWRLVSSDSVHPLSASVVAALRALLLGSA